MKKSLLLTTLLALASTSFAAQNGQIIKVLNTGATPTTLDIPVHVEGNIVDGTKKRLVVTFDNGLSPDNTLLRFTMGDVITGETSKMATSNYTAKVVTDATGTLSTTAKISGGLSRNGAALALTAKSSNIDGNNTNIDYILTGVETTTPAQPTASVAGSIGVRMTAGTQAGPVMDSSVVFKLKVEGENN